MYQTILFEVVDGVGKLVLNRPDRLNSFTVAMHEEVAEALATVEQDPNIRTLLLTGAGRGFCAGQDLSDRSVAPGGEAVDLGRSVELYYAPLIRRLSGMDKPVVCAVNGVAAGAGANIALACDIVIAARSAKFIQSFANIGLIPDSGGTWVLPRLVGLARALGLAMTGEPLLAEKAESWGMIWKVVDDETLEAEAMGLARKFASGPTRGLAATKHAIRGSSLKGLSDELDLERDLMRALGQSARLPGRRGRLPRQTPARLHRLLNHHQDPHAMTMMLKNYARDTWVEASGGLQAVHSAVTGHVVAQTGSQGLDFKAMLDHARSIGSPALRAMSFHARAKLLKTLAEAIMTRRDELYELSWSTGATKTDGWIDIEGGAGTLFAMSSKGRRELPDDVILTDGDLEPIGKRGTFVGQHVYTSLQGAAVHINAFNFPVWGMLEKLGPTLLAGVPAIVKPASATGYVTEAAFRILIEAGVLPPGALQLIVGQVGDLFDHLTCQDVVSFTGSADTAMKLQAHPTIGREGVRFIAERDSLNATILAPDAVPGTPEFDLFVKEVVTEMTTKAGQKCTAIRRALVPAEHLAAAEEALKACLSKVVVGDPQIEGVTMGALASVAQLKDVREKARELGADAQLVFGDIDHVDAKHKGEGEGAYISPLLFRADKPWSSDRVHDVEAFGPVSTLMPYKDLHDAIALANRGKGSLALSVFTYDPATARQLVLGVAAFHGRIVFIDRDCSRESTGHGSPLPMLVHGGPGRAGGGEEMGGVRGVKHYMQRSALQGSPRTLSAIIRRWLPGAPQPTGEAHPFRLRFGEVELGYTLNTAARTITLEDIEHFAEFTGDTFYAHMDEEAAAANPFFPGRVAHGYLILSFAAGLFVDPAPGPVLANYGLDNLRFLKPLSPGHSIRVALTVMSKTARNPEYGEVRWAVKVVNAEDETVATYELLTMNAV